MALLDSVILQYFSVSVWLTGGATSRNEVAGKLVTQLSVDNPIFPREST